ncbi:PIF-5 [Crangon crangon nudivirus]|uniref:PIF-5 n=1 Tax=Crangon crangon nudivirus TaxID=2880838 RepID=A0AAE8Y019_9VIRU|nr:PIF-5 [Crangon crangon nudivirus]UBZ25490.1 PIF-5 [Crangon crangon nudivirus]
MGKAWLKAIRAGTRAVCKLPGSTMDEIAVTVKGAKSGVHSIDDTLKQLELKDIGGEVKVNNARWRDVEPKLREGKIKSALDDMEVSNTISGSDEAVLRKSLKLDAPDIEVKDLENKQLAAKKIHSDVDVIPDGESTGDALKNKMSASGRSKATAWYKILVGAGQFAAYGVGIFTMIYLGTNVWDNILDATNRRNGCFVVTKDGRVKACKLMDRTCYTAKSQANEDKEILPCGEPYSTLMRNIYLMIADIKQNSKTDDVATLTAAGVTNMDKSIDEILSVPANVAILVEQYRNIYPKGTETFNSCELIGLTKGCVACDSSVSTTSVNYADLSELEGNVTIQCITDSSVLDTLMDVATGMGVDLFGSASDSISGSFKGNFFLIFFIVVVVAAVIAIVLKFKSKPKEIAIQHDPQPYPYPPQQQQQLQQQPIYQQQPPPPQEQYIEQPQSQSQGQPALPRFDNSVQNFNRGPTLHRNAEVF